MTSDDETTATMTSDDETTPPLGTIEAPIIEFSDIRSITFTVTVPWPSMDQIFMNAGLIFTKTQLTSNGVDYGPFKIMFSLTPTFTTFGFAILIESETPFKEYKAVTGDLTLDIQSVSRQKLKTGGYYLKFVVPSSVPDSPTKYPYLKLILGVEPKQPDLSSDLLQFYHSQDNADVTFSFEGKELKAHKLILSARSDYFRRMFSAEMKENQTGEIKIIDFEPDVFEEALIFLYSGFTSRCLDRKLIES